MDIQGIKLTKQSFSPVWRILVCTAILQLGGALYVLSQNFFSGILTDISYGAALATPTGFIFGFIWQAAHSKESVLENLGSISTLFVLSLLVSGMTVFFPAYL